MKKFALAELEYAFGKWNENGSDFPKMISIGILCESFRLEEMKKLTPVGCERCDWTGWYESKGKTAGSVEIGHDPAHSNKNIVFAGKYSDERKVLPCPCRTNPDLRTACPKKLATEEDMRWMWTEIKRIAAEKDMNKAIEKPAQMSGAIPTSRELAETLTKRGHWHLLGGKD